MDHGKTNLRKSLFKDHTKPAAVKLMQSSLLSPHIFPKEAVASAVAQGPVRNMSAVLGLNTPMAQRKNYPATPPFKKPRYYFNTKHNNHYQNKQQPQTFRQLPSRQEYHYRGTPSEKYSGGKKRI